MTAIVLGIEGNLEREYIADLDLWVGDESMLGMRNERGQLVMKMWRVATVDHHKE